MSTSRLEYHQYLSKELGSLNQIETCIAGYELDSKLIELVKLRVSQLNGCSFCVRYHTLCLRWDGETDERIDLISVWEESPCFSLEEKAALRWAENVTLLADKKLISDRLYAETVEVLGEQGLSQLTLAVAMINVWNRLAVPFQTDHRFVDELLKAKH